MLRLVLIAWLALCGVANAQLSGGLQFPGPGTAHSAGGGGLMLDGITTGIKAAYSTRKLLTAYAGNAIRVERASDTTQQNIGFASNVLDTSSLGTFCSGTSCRVVTWYDQSGGAFDQTQTFATAPIIYQSGAANFINTTRPALLFVAATPSSLANGSLSSNPVNTLFQNAVVSVNTTTQSGGITAGSLSGRLIWRINQTSGAQNLLSDLTANIAASSSGVTSLTAAIVESEYNNVSGAYSFWLNAAADGTGTQAQALSAGTIVIGTGQTGVEALDGSIGEIVLYDQVGSFASRTTVETNQKAYWGTP